MKKVSEYDIEIHPEISIEKVDFEERGQTAPEMSTEQKSIEQLLKQRHFSIPEGLGTIVDTEHSAEEHTAANTKNDSSQMLQT